MKKNVFLLALFVLFCPVDLFSMDVASKVTFITTTSPSVSHPRTIFIQMTQFSFWKNVPDFDSIPKIIVFDAPKKPEDKARYDQYKENMKKIVATHPHFKNTKLVFLEKWGCLVGALKEAFKHVKTEYVFLHQDDFELVKPIDLKGLLSAMDKNHNIKMVRLNSGINAVGLSNACDFHIDDYVEGGTTFPILRTPGWGDNDHIARKDYYDNFVFPTIGDKPTFMEAVLMKPCATEFPQQHLKYGTYLYGPWNEGPYIYHLDRHSAAW